MSQLHYETHGSADNPALLLVHGFLSSNAQWLPNIESLSTRFHLVTAELWGHGQSPLPDGDLTVERYLNAFEHIRGQLAIEHWGVIGQSYAAGIAIRYAIAHPARVDGLMITNSRSALGNLEANGPKRSQQPIGEVLDNNRHLPIHPIFAKRIPEPTKSALVEAADNISHKAIGAGSKLGSQLNSIGLLGDIPCPFIIANGVYEKSFQKDMREIKQIDGLNVVDLDGGHAVNIEAADQFNELVVGFFN